MPNYAKHYGFKQKQNKTKHKSHHSGFPHLPPSLSGWPTQIII